MGISLEIMKRRPIRTRLQAAIAPLIITGAMGTALLVASSTTSAPETENLCISGGSVHTLGTNANTVTEVHAPAWPFAAQISVNTCSHPCDALYQTQTELCGTKDSLCMSQAADRHGDCRSAYK
jgi:hypothetical protein